MVPGLHTTSAGLPEGIIVVSYDHQRSALGEILIARFTEADVRRAEARSPMAALLHVVKRAGKPGGSMPQPAATL